MRIWVLLPLFLLACSKQDTTEPTETGTFDSDTSDSADTEPDTERDTAPPKSMAPKIQSCDAYCEWHDIGDTYWKWTVGCNVTDPDGLENIWNGATTVSRGNTAVADYLVACNTSGLCTTGFREDTDNILCSQANSYKFVVKITDWDGHESLPYEVVGRQK
ncbi:MAG: hypothetical protein VXW32_15225 [Myxococcota bacterium]|nr:hypothetical protein [Myxococcota bacterium]